MIKSATDSDTPQADENDYLPARMINEFTYCPRLFYLEHVEGLFAHNADTIEGTAKHGRVDKKTDPLPKAKEKTKPSTAVAPRAATSSADSTSANDRDKIAADASTEAFEKIHARSVTLGSERYCVLAKLDLIEAEGQVATPVDYKRGSPKKLDDGSLGAWDPERVQLCVQALLLRENGYQCDEGVLFFWETRQRVRIAIDDDLVAITQQAISGARSAVAKRQLPPPLVDSPKCPRCSLVSICLPDETTYCSQSATDDSRLAVQTYLFDIGLRFERNTALRAAPPQAVRQLVTARDERRPLYLNTQGYSVGISSEVLQVKEKGKVVQKIRLNDVSHVNLFGAVQVSTQAIQVLLQKEIPLIYFSFGGWFHGMTQPVGLKNIMWRREQFRMADRPDFCLRFARQLVIGKIRNQRTLLMRNHVEPPPEALRFLKSLVGEAERAKSLAELLGFEGLAARTYFENFSGMLKVQKPSLPGGQLELFDDPIAETSTGESLGLSFDFSRRNRRPPRDPVNALLSLGYSLLAKDLTITVASVGLDPYLGFYHQPRFGRPSLALDLMEPFRPLIVDSAILSAINQRMVTEHHFIAAGDSVALTPEGRKGFFGAYEQRMDQLVTHPVFGYRVSYRRVLEIQTRLLARVLMGEIIEYPVFVTR